MRLTWRDAVTAAFMAAIVAVYLAHLNDATGWLLSSVRGNATAILVLGAVGGCALGTAAELYRSPDEDSVTKLYLMLANLLGLTALVGALVALIAASEAALAVLFAATMALWVISTVRHLSRETPLPIRGADHRTPAGSPPIH
ncbi:hypothetical protein KGA66_26055 [Actinocrinis puniceicyclus]|uniref:Uncharacterized protein n=1 Tax=Actinocrinis puniceicyclus TaxID=977794 RepID=A0A8J7WTM3_9ACTN|nr:hypothetical protein [Actinocrinis puniceicyclus]MBS2966530.1 hypothetical protein [Actinocrinis puniceicyclus]